jgi:Lon protease-like protein
MKKEFVPYNESLELKELGFDEPCFTSYNNKDLVNWWEDAEPVKNSELVKRYITAPTFSQAFRWFREKHNLHSCVAPVYEYEISKVIVYWFWIQGFDNFEDDDINYKTPEEAELACLQKLIEIVKKTHNNISKHQ